jgi:hypothetical protein
MNKTMSELVTDLLQVRDCKRELASKTKLLNEQETLLKHEVLRRLNEEGEVGCKTSAGTVTKTSLLIASMQNWELFWPWVKEFDADHLLTRSICNQAYRELIQSGEIVPGLEPVELINLSVRKA